MLYDLIKADMTAALKAGEVLRLAVLRMLVSAIGYRAIDLGRSLTDAEVLEVISREVKKRKEAVASYQAAGRGTQADVEKQEMEILVKYLPAQITEDELRITINELRKRYPQSGFAEMMKKAMGELKGKADGAVVARIVKELVDA